MAVKGGAALRRRWRIIDRNVRHGIAAAMNDVAEDLLDRSNRLCPQLEDVLIKTGDIAKRDRRDTFARVVYYDTVYAMYQHEGVFYRHGKKGAPLTPGPKTRLKPSTDDGPPGAKFLERPYMRHRTRYRNEVGKAMVHSIRLSVR